ncbi:MAG TPA: AsmA-like C-terminal region-containing protein [Candidatus Binataceae bacterium]|jgi:uncharacterized protein involved in outer membrane biogenesis|nr:AsmA-like C-terminal region-containing protein [Candidatus Binataceae bacterium]
MHRVLRIAGLAVAGAVLIAAAVTALAAYNLTALVTHNQNRILYRVSKALGRSVQVGHITAHVGLGLSIEADDLKIADDPAFSHDPFLSAAQASLDVKFLPLLRGKIKVHRLEFTKPTIRILRQANGRLNIDTLGEGAPADLSVARHRGGAGAARGVVWAIARDVSIKGLAIDDGTVYYSDPTLKGVPLQLNHLSVELSGFHTGSAFDVDIKSALFSDQPNLELSGKAGPMLRQGGLDIPDCPLDLTFKTGPLTIDNLRTLLAPGAIVPVTLSMPGPVTATGTIKGTLAEVQVAASSDFSSYRIVYRAAANKPSAPPLTLNLSGKSAVSGTVRPLEAKTGWDFTVALTQVASSFEGAQLPAVVGLNGRVHLTPTRLELQPTTFTLGSEPASLEANADSITPLRAAFTFKADSLQLSQIVPSRPPGEFVKQLLVSGTARGDLSAPVVNARITSGSGLVERLAYGKLDMNTSYAGNRVSAQPLSVQVFNGSVLANVNAVLADRPPFDASADLRHINVGELFRWLDVHSSAISGFLSVDARVSGAGSTWKEIQPTMRSNGRMYLSGGELHGVNIVAVALNKIAVAPVVSQLVGVAFRSSHQGVFDSSNTDLSQASMTFNLYGQRVDTNDLLVQSPEYQITGAGWFDLDKNINMTGDIKLTLGLSAAIPVVVMGKYPALLVLPNIPKLAERTAVGVVSAPMNIIKGGANAVGNVFGGLKSLLP